MQADDLAEYGIDRVESIFADVLNDPDRSSKLLEHIRYRTGLLLERRHGVFGFAHLTFQEYLAACAVHEGNRLDIDAERLVREHDDGRWSEVIALYCGLATLPAARSTIECLIAQPDTSSLSEVLTEAYLSTKPEILQDCKFRKRVLERIAIAPGAIGPGNRGLGRFPPEEISPIANEYLGKAGSSLGLSGAYSWLYSNRTAIDEQIMARRLKKWRELNPYGLSELVYLAHNGGSDALFQCFESEVGIYESPGTSFEFCDKYSCQAEIALLGLSQGNRRIGNSHALQFGMAQGSQNTIESRNN